MTGPDWQMQLHRSGFAFAEAPAMRAALGELPDWAEFAASWDDLGLDTYMADGGRYRKRRHAAYRVEPGGHWTRKPAQPHYQSRDFNALNGGIARWFDPVAETTERTASFDAILRLCERSFAGPGDPPWHVELHQFRIEARPDQAGRPTPEGAHQDGVDWVLVLMIRRENIAEGETSIHGLDRTPLGHFTLREPLDAAWIDDHRVFHGVTPVRAFNPAAPAFRDVLVVTFRREG